MSFTINATDLSHDTPLPLVGPPLVNGVKSMVVVMSLRGEIVKETTPTKSYTMILQKYPSDTTSQNIHCW